MTCSMCDCDRALELLSLELDGELTPEEKRELEGHLAACGECRGAAEELRQLRALLPELEEEVPDGLHQAIMDRIGAEKVVPLSRVSKKSRIRRWASLAAVFAVILLGAGTLKTLQSSGSTGAAPAAASVTTAESAQDTVGAAGGDAGQAEIEGKGKEANLSDGDALPSESAPAVVQEDAEAGGSGAILRMSPPASAQPTPAPAQEVGDVANGQESDNQAVTFSVLPAEAATTDGAVQPDGDTTETLRANCAAWLAASAFEQKDRVDTTLVSIAQVTEGELTAAVCDDENAALMDGTDWAVTLGDTSGHDYAILLCDSETLAVLGYVPIA